MSRPAVMAVDARLATLNTPAWPSGLAQMRQVERNAERRILNDLVECDHVNAHEVRVLREVRRRIAETIF